MFPRAAARTLAMLMLITLNVVPGTGARIGAAPAPPGDPERARALLAQKSFNAALPDLRVFFDQRVRAHRADVTMRLDMVASLSNAAFENGPRGPVTRSSVERVALMCEALGVLDGALKVARNGSEAAQVLDRQSQTFFLWGFPWDALVYSNAAVGADPANREIRARAAEMVRRFRELDH